jgi:phospholipid-binding lipoprotein MlaA
MNRSRTALLVLLSAAALAVGCAGPNPVDPWERVNRPVFRFNDAVDRKALGPVARGWKRISSEGVRTSVSNFFYNVQFPSRFVSNVGQAEGQQAMIETARFVVNSTVGVVGIFDPASSWGLPRRDEDIGQMFGRWGIPPGPYWMIPLLGPSNPRDAVGRVGDSLLSPFFWINVLLGIPTFGGPTVVDLVNERAIADERIESARRSALDYYVFVRDAFMQYREAAIRNRGGYSPYGADPAAGAGPDDDLYEVDGAEGEKNAP